MIVIVERPTETETLYICMPPGKCNSVCGYTVLACIPASVALCTPVFLYLQIYHLSGGRPLIRTEKKVEIMRKMKKYIIHSHETELLKITDITLLLLRHHQAF